MRTLKVSVSEEDYKDLVVMTGQRMMVMGKELTVGDFAAFIVKGWCNARRTEEENKGQSNRDSGDDGTTDDTKEDGA